MRAENETLSESDLDKLYAFKISHGTKVFQDVYVRVGNPITLDSIPKAQIEKYLVALKQ